MKQGTERKKPFSINCPTCEQKLSESKIAELRKAQEEDLAVLAKEVREKQAELEEIKTKGLQIAEKIKEKQEADKQKIDAFEKQKAERINVLKNEIEKLIAEKNRLQKAIDEYHQNKKKALNEVVEKGVALSNELKQLKSESAKMIEAFEKDLVGLREQVQQLEQEEKNAIITNANRETLAMKEKERVEELKKLMDSEKRLEEAIKKCNAQIFYIKQFNLKRVEILHQQMEKHLNRVSINLQKFNESTGEVKDCFEVKYDGKPIYICSLSEQMRAGMEISGMIAIIQGSNFPLFLDNSESITHYSAYQKQIIEAHVKKGVSISKHNGNSLEPVRKKTAI